MEVGEKAEWWRDSVIYQLIVPSFRDTTGDGMGDLDGVLQRLDYLQWLGVGAVWLSPIYPSPFIDLGYDVRDYTNVDSRFGTLATLDELVAQAHQRDIAVILDWVPAHTSSEHPWFIEACEGRDSHRRNWYVWADARENGSPPNNWISIFGGSAWQWHEPTGQYYLHTFHRTQPDLNWHNVAVQDAMLQTLRFWLDRGIDGFRIDACCLLLKDPQLRDNPTNPEFHDGDGPDSRLLSTRTRDQPGLHEILARIRRLVDSYDDRVLLGELYLPLDKIVEFYGRERPELHLPMHMAVTWTQWSAAALGGVIDDYETRVREHGWPAIVLSTHDTPRLAARAGRAQARVGAMLLATLRGTPVLYYGEEIGMCGVSIAPEQARDPQGRRTGRNRDGERTPMQWNGHEPNAGFSDAEPWLPVADDVADCSVLGQSHDPHSLLSLVRRLIEVRSGSAALRGGDYRRIDGQPPDVYAYRRSAGAERLVVALNFGHEPRSARLDAAGGTIMLSTHLDRDGEHCTQDLALRSDEGVIVVIDAE